MIEAIREHWGWTDVEPQRVHQRNKFGNVIFEDHDGRYWRICPEEASCSLIAESEQEYARLQRDEDFTADWNMDALVEAGEGKFGPLPADRCFCLKIPGVLGGKYEPDNLGTISVAELIRFAGDLGNQLQCLPDGSPVQFEFVD